MHPRASHNVRLHDPHKASLLVWEIASSDALLFVVISILHDRDD